MARPLFFCGEAGRPPARVTDLTGSQKGATRAAVARLAAVWKVEPGGERGLQHWLPRAHVDRAVVRPDSDRVFVGTQGNATERGL